MGTADDPDLSVLPAEESFDAATQTRAMSLPVFTSDEAALRALDPKCADPKSTVSWRIVALLAAESLAYKKDLLTRSTSLGLGNLVRCALKAHTSPDSILDAEEGNVPMLHLAVKVGATRALKALLAGGANIELTDKNRATALAEAARYGQPSCLQLLLDAGANANAQDFLGNTPLVHAVMSKHVECVRALLPVTDLRITNILGRTALHAAVNMANEACFELVLAKVSDVDVRTVPGVDGRTREAIPVFNKTALHMACERGLLTMCKALLSRGADRMARDSRQWTPLHLAAREGHLSCAVMLVGRPDKVRMTPAEVDAVTENGATALHFAAAKGCDQICCVLLGAGAKLDVKAKDGWTPHMVAQQNHPANVALHALLSVDGPAQPPGLVCDHCGLTAEHASVRSLKDCGKMLCRAPLQQGVPARRLAGAQGGVQGAGEGAGGGDAGY